MKVFRKIVMFIIVMAIIGLSGCGKVIKEIDEQSEKRAKLSYNKEIIVISTVLDSTVYVTYVLKYQDISVEKVKIFDVNKGDTIIDLQKLFEDLTFEDKPEIVNAKIVKHTYEDDSTVLRFCKKYNWGILILLLLIFGGGSGEDTYDDYWPN